MKKWLYNAERKYGHLGIENLMLYICSTTFIIYLVSIFMPNLNILNFISLSRSKLLQGQIWRLVTFVFYPPNFHPLFIFVSLYFYYSIGRQIEQVWGTFRFTLYYVVGVVGIIISALITGYGTVEPLNLSLFLAFATIFPEERILFNFFIPIKMKYLSLLYIVLMLPNFLIGSVAYKFSVVFSLLGFILFLGRDFLDVYANEAFIIKRKIQNFFNNRR